MSNFSNAIFSNFACGKSVFILKIGGHILSCNILTAATLRFKCIFYGLDIASLAKQVLHLVVAPKVC